MENHTRLSSSIDINKSHDQSPSIFGDEPSVSDVSQECNSQPNPAIFSDGKSQTGLKKKDAEEITPKPEFELESETTIHLISEDPNTECDFWVGLTIRGELSPTTLLNLENISDIFTAVATKGIEESGPIMLSDSNFTPPRSVYLVAIPDENTETWTASILETIKTWAPKHIGFYLAPEALDTAIAENLLIELLSRTITGNKIEKVYLYTGSHGLNRLVNTAQSLRTKLKAAGRDILVYH